MRKLIFVLLLLSSMSAGGSREGVLLLGKFRLESAGIGSSGRVVVSGSQGDRGPEAIRVEAFGRSYSLSGVHIRQLRGLAANGIQLSYEGGYREQGGRTIYILFSTGITSGTEAARYVSVSERGDIRVQNARPR